MRKLVTQVTVNKINDMVEKNMRYSKELKYLLTEMLCSYGCYGATLAQMKKWGCPMSNQCQINVYESNELRGMGVLFNEYFSTVFCADLHHVNIKDFNGLVNACANHKD